MPSSASKKKVCLRSEEHTSELQSLTNLVCRLLLEKKYRPATSLCYPAARRRPRGPLLLVDAPRGRDRAGPPARRERFFFNDTATTEIYPLSLHDALPILFTLPTEKLGGNAWTKLITNGWQISGVTMAQTGAPFTPSVSVQNSSNQVVTGSYTEGSRPVRVAGCNPYTGSGNWNTYLNPACF